MPSKYAVLQVIKSLYVVGFMIKRLHEIHQCFQQTICLSYGISSAFTGEVDYLNVMSVVGSVWAISRMFLLLTLLSLMASADSLLHNECSIFVVEVVD